MARGDWVVVRCYGNKPAIRRVWDADDETVAITNAVHYKALLWGMGNPPEPVWFRRRDVFVYDSALCPLGIEGTPQDAAFWKRLQPYTDYS